MAERRLSMKQKRFIEAYLGEDKANFNATKAAEMAGYKGNGVTLASVGYENLRNPQIKKEIDIHLQASAMSSNETMMRIGDIGRNDLNKSQMKALELLAKHHGLLDEKIHIRVENELENLLGILEQSLEGDTYNRVLEILAQHSEA